MDIESQIKTLMEMGFPRDQAVKALKVTGHDANKAIAYLFGEFEEPQGNGTENAPIEIDDPPVQVNLPPQPQSHQHQEQFDTVDVKVPDGLPDYLGQFVDSGTSSLAQASSRGDEFQPPPIPSAPRPQVADLTRNSTEFIEVEGRSEPSSYRNYSSNSSSDDEGDGRPDYRGNVALSDSSSNMSECSIPNVKTEGHLVPVLRKKIWGYRYWVSVLSILSRSKHFSEVVMSVPEETVTPFIEELQKIVDFVQNFKRYKEWYMLVDGLLRATGPNVPQEDVSPGEEAINNIYKELTDAIPDLKSVLASLVESVEENISNEIPVLEVDPDIRKQTLYQTLNGQFWEQNFTNLGVVKYNRISPVVTIHLINEDDYNSQPFFVDEYFYPEIYSDKALKEVQRHVSLLREVEHERRALSRSLIDLNFFEGKRLGNLLRQATEVLKSENGEAGADLEQLTNSVNELRERTVERQTQANKTSEQNQFSHFRDVIRALPNLNRYRLQGIIMNDEWYYVRQRDVWVKMDVCELVDFELVISDVRNCTMRGSQPVTLLYVNAEGEPAWTDSEEGSSDDDLIMLSDEETKSSKEVELNGDEAGQKYTNEEDTNDNGGELKKEDEEIENVKSYETCSQ
uniref:UBA domain-containing protein n=1 Tax=Candidozyma auris TaxID=498019 RepID=A0A2H1A6Q4_CANAR|nr:hypothetical protein B9J08_001051 [[Candida] auris]